MVYIIYGLDFIALLAGTPRTSAEPEDAKTNDVRKAYRKLAGVSAREVPLGGPLESQQTDRLRESRKAVLFGIRGIWDLSIFLEVGRK